MLKFRLQDIMVEKTPSLLERINRLEALYHTATGGQWKAQIDEDDDNYGTISGSDWTSFAKVVTTLNSEKEYNKTGLANLSLITEMQNNLPELIKAARESEHYWNAALEVAATIVDRYAHIKDPDKCSLMAGFIRDRKTS